VIVDFPLLLTAAEMRAADQAIARASKLDPTNAMLRDVAAARAASKK